MKLIISLGILALGLTSAGVFAMNIDGGTYSPQMCYCPTCINHEKPCKSETELPPVREAGIVASPAGVSPAGEEGNK